MMKRLILLLIPVLLAACAQAPVQVPPPAPAPVVVLPPPPPPPPPCPPPSPLVELFDYYQRLRTAPNAEQQREASQLQQQSAPRSDALILQQAMLATLGHGPADPGRLLQQLENLQKSREEASAPLRPLAALLFNVLSEQRRLEEQNEKTATLLKDEQKRRETIEEKQAALQEKLEGLKAIERNLLNRPQGKKP